MPSFLCGILCILATQKTTCNSTALLTLGDPVQSIWALTMGTTSVNLVLSVNPIFSVGLNTAQLKQYVHYKQSCTYINQSFIKYASGNSTTKYADIAFTHTGRFISPNKCNILRSGAVNKHHRTRTTRNCTIG